VISGILGGVGIFLMGMILLSEGLKAAAGDALRGILERFVHRPFSALVSGMAVTALVQSSSATTLTTIGFVSAGLLTFPQAVGLILGANLGTTSTGWIVAILGLKISVSAVALPLVGLGALARLLGRGRGADLGLALAGFGLIFVGIDVLQGGMEGLADRIDPASFPDVTLVGRVLLIVVGVAMTVVMQSSSAAVAMTLTALHAGNLTVEQTAYLVIGQNVGTTVKAALAATGASIPARRTAVAHILFNVGAALLAILALPVLLPLSVRLAGEGDPALAIAIFHTAFNLLGVLVFLPFLEPFAKLVERLVPERTPLITRHLDRSVAEIPSVAVEVARRATTHVGGALFHTAASGGGDGQAPMAEARAALEKIREFLGWVHSSPEGGNTYGRHLSVIHAVDHLDRFAHLLHEDRRLLTRPATGLEGEWEAERHRLRSALLAWIDVHPVGSLPAPSPPPGERMVDVALEPRFREISECMADVRKRYRDQAFRDAASGRVEPDEAWAGVDRLKRLDALAYHAWRVVNHLELSGPDQPGDSKSAPGEPEVFADREEEHD